MTEEKFSSLLKQVTDLEQKVKKAKSYALWDLLGGGGLVSYIKRRQMQDIQADLDQLQADLLKFPLDFKSDFDARKSYFWDVYWDNVWTDAKTRNSLKQLAEQLKALREDIEKAINS